MMEAELDRKNDERVEEIAYSILDRRNNGTSERQIKNCIPAAEMLRYAQTWSRYLEYRIKKKGENLDDNIEIIQSFEEYYNLHLLVIRRDIINGKIAVELKVINDPRIEITA